MKNLCIMAVVILILSSSSYAATNINTNYAFQDLEKAPWASEAIQALYGKGIINGYNENEYGVNDPITREQLAKLLSLTFKVDTEE